MSIIFDATLRQGDFVAMIGRTFRLTETTKRASTKQVIFHCAALKGSLNAQTLAGYFGFSEEIKNSS